MVHLEPAVAREPLADHGIGIRSVEIESIVYNDTNVTEYVSDCLPVHYSMYLNKCGVDANRQILNDPVNNEQL